MGAVTGVGNADNFARLFSLALDGTLISNRTLQLIAQPTVANWHLEQVNLPDALRLNTLVLIVAFLREMTHVLKCENGKSEDEISSAKQLQWIGTKAL